MIIKSKSHRSKAAYFNVLSYVMRKEAQYKDQKDNSLLLKHNLYGKSIEQYTKQFQENLEFREIIRSDNININHIILSLHPKDSSSEVSVEVLKDLTNHYIELKGENGMYLATAHFDAEHLHVHVVESPLEIRTGKSMRMSKAEFSKLQQEMQKYQKEHYPELDNSLVNYGNSKKKL
jgi:type IV secretory pathway VirD2 relaxase